MPKVLKDTLDKERGDIPRSRYITKILQQQVTCKKEKENENLNVSQQQSKCSGQRQQSSANSRQGF
jgi:hypothetical protein